jgi:hypothetical protein
LIINTRHIVTHESNVWLEEEEEEDDEGGVLGEKVCQKWGCTERLEGVWGGRGVRRVV